MRVIGLDFGKTMGLAVMQRGELIESSSVKLPDDHGARFDKFFYQLHEASDYKFGSVVFAYESVARHIGTKAAHSYGGYLALLQMFCYRRELPCHGVPVGTLKKYATGNGRASKNEMVKATNDKYKLKLRMKDNNEADAIWVADWCWNEIKEGKSEFV